MANGADIGSLGRLALFADLSRPELERIAHTYDEEMFPEGQRVLRQGLSGSNIFVILDGEAAVVIDGVERLRLGRGEFFGETSALLGLERFLTDHPSVAVRMLKVEVQRLADTLQWLN